MNTIEDNNQVNIPQDFQKLINLQIQQGEYLLNQTLMSSKYDDTEDSLYIYSKHEKQIEQKQVFTEDKYNSINDQLSNLEFNGILEKEIIEINIEQLEQKRSYEISDYNYNKIQSVKNILNELNQKVLKFHFNIQKNYNKAKEYTLVQVDFSQIPLLKMKIQSDEKDEFQIDNFIALLFIRWIYPKDFINLFLRNDFQTIPENIEQLFQGFEVNEQFQQSFTKFQQKCDNENKLFFDSLVNTQRQDFSQDDDQTQNEIPQKKSDHRYYDKYQLIDNIFDVANLKLDSKFEDYLEKNLRPLEDHVVKYPLQQKEIQIIKNQEKDLNKKKNYLEIFKRISEEFYEHQKQQGTQINDVQNILLDKDFNNIDLNLQKNISDIKINIDDMKHCFTHFQFFKKLAKQKIFFKLKTKFDNDNSILTFTLQNYNENEEDVLYSKVSFERSTPSYQTQYLKMYFIMSTFKQFIYYKFFATVKKFNFQF